jgi:hypothetical protein
MGKFLPRLSITPYIDYPVCTVTDRKYEYVNLTLSRDLLGLSQEMDLEFIDIKTGRSEH